MGCRATGIRGDWLIQTSLLAVITLLASANLLAQTGAGVDENLSRESLKIAQIYAAVERNYADSVDPDAVILEGAVRRMLSSLDPFSAFFNRDQFEELGQQARGEALGFGSILYVQPGKVTVLQTREGSPAWRAGLGPGDEIVSLNGTRLSRLDFESMIELLRQSRSHPARLGVIRPGRLVAQDFELKPAEVSLPTVDKAVEFSPGIGYAHVTSFEQKTAQEVADALTYLGGSAGPKGLTGLILDLRDNHGGLLDASIAVASLFLRPETSVLTVRGRTTPEKTYQTASAPRYFDGPLIVLVNENTASAAEVVAAALQEHDRALVAGESTFGKGVVEGIFALSEKTGLALTTAQYFTPSGRSIQRPLPGTALSGALAEEAGTKRPAETGGQRNAQRFRTDAGRPVSAGGGVTPDVRIPGRTLDPWATFLEQRGLVASFASEHLTLHGKADSSFTSDSKVLNDFKSFLARQQIRTPDEYWKQDEDYLKLRIKAEVFNLAFGLARGDEVEVRGDPQIQKAAALIPRISDLMRTAR